jgi:hypothetical protein
LQGLPACEFAKIAELFIIPVNKKTKACRLKIKHFQYQISEIYIKIEQGSQGAVSAALSLPDITGEADTAAWVHNTLPVFALF